MRPDRRPYDVVKGAIDIVASTIGLVLTAPLQLLLAGLLFLAQGRPVLFRQDRPGRDSQIFELLKFRSMRQPNDAYRTDAERLTRIGGFIRRTSLDELPSLVNVLKGDMSLVGPRPLRTHYLPLYSAEQARRHEVRPGITGLAQVRGRNLLSWEDRFELDVEYVDRRSFALDMGILFRTAVAVLARTGISAEGEATMTPFKGSE